MSIAEILCVKLVLKKYHSFNYLSVVQSDNIGRVALTTSPHHFYITNKGDNLFR